MGNRQASLTYPLNFDLVKDTGDRRGLLSRSGRRDGLFKRQDRRKKEVRIRFRPPLPGID